MIEVIVIERLGARGDGVAIVDGAPVHIAGVLPGEHVLADINGERGRALSIEKPSPLRREPLCTLFGTCGGCAVQHTSETVYRDWKQANAVNTLTRAGLIAPSTEMVDAHGEGRRRVVLHVRRIGNAVRAGFMMARSHELVPVETCPVLVPELQSAASVAEKLATIVGLAKPIDVQVTATLGGLDVDMRGQGPLRDPMRIALGRAADKLDLARLSLHGDLIVERRAPLIQMGAARVLPPPGGFLQATAAGEDAMSARVMAATEGAKRIADLFAGVGPFALRLAQRAEVHAVENDAAALDALDRAWRGTQGLKRVTREARDLFRRPLLPQELASFDAIVLDPPRAGAEMQVKQIAASSISRVVMVSCDATTFARDAKILVDAGFVMGDVALIDQFRHSSHVELVCTFSRANTRKKGGGR
jgi:23S rRNA (uracil1939-C5)-methyltransferase